MAAHDLQDQRVEGLDPLARCVHVAGAHRFELARPIVGGGIDIRHAQEMRFDMATVEVTPPVDGGLQEINGKGAFV